MYKIVVAISLMTKPDNGEAFYKIFILLKSRHVMRRSEPPTKWAPSPARYVLGDLTTVTAQSA
jgi:hypothetical protein